MNKRAEKVTATTLCLCALMIVFVIAGCSTLQSKKDASKSATSSSSSTTASMPVSPDSVPTTSSSPQQEAKEDAPVYYDFGDIMVPRALSVIKKDSLVMTSGGVTSGILVLKGSVDVDSLSNFFENKMPIDGWRQMGSFRSARSIFLFEKPTRWCVIAINDGSFNSTVEIWVAPMDSQSRSGGAR